MHLGQIAAVLARADAEIARMRADRMLVWAVAGVAVAEILVVGRWILGGG